MRRLFVSPGSLSDSEVRVQGLDFHHLVHVLRVKPGESLILPDGAGEARTATIAEITKREIVAQITGAATIPPDPPIDVTVAQALGKGDRFEQVLQHATEVGANGFIPLITARTVVRLDERSGKEKVERWTSIVKGAAEQSGRARIPAVFQPSDLSSVISRFSDFAHALILDASGEPLRRIVSHWEHVEQSPCILLVGPEGGFTPEEIEAARAAGATAASLGPFILRTETAAVAALSQLLFWGDDR